MTPTALDTLIGWLLGIMGTIVATIVGWALTIDRRVGKLETISDAASRKLDKLDEKLDKLIDKLL